MLRIVIGFWMALGVLVAPAAFAQEFNMEPNITKTNVTFSAQELQDQSQAKAVYARLYKAVQYVCQTDGDGPTWRIADDRACENEAMQDALHQLGRQELSRLYVPGAPQLARVDEKRKGR